MPLLKFPAPFRHDHPPVRDVNAVLAQRRTPGEAAADAVAATVGSWRFIIVQSCLLAVWVALNVGAWVRHWDPYPFILMNLVLSLQAAYTAPIIMMSQNRQAARDRVESQQDYLVNQRSETEIHAILDHLAAQDRALAEIHALLLGRLAGADAVRQGGAGAADLQPEVCNGRT